jgi:two-component system, NtrC family, sensor histidine kinase PilS
LPFYFYLFTLVAARGSVVRLMLMAPGNNKIEQTNPLGQKLWWLIIGRLAAAMVLLLVDTLWTPVRGGPGSLPNALTILLLVIGLTIVYSLAHRFSDLFGFQARVQFFVDILMVTWLVWRSDVIHSPYTALYIVIIASASVFLGPRGVAATAVGCTFAFTACALALITGVGQRPEGVILVASLSQTVQSIALFDMAFLAVGLLSARIAARQSRSDVRLRATRQTLANLRALHERIVESIRSGVVTTDLEGRIYTLNAAAAEITGYKEQGIRGESASIFFGDLSERIAQSVRAIDAGETVPRFEADCLTAEGLRLRLGFGISPLFAESGETTGMVITFQDLTEIRALEETSRRQDRLAAIGRMAASIAHEIRNPLAAMRGSIQMLKSEIDNERSQIELMEIILRESDRLNRIITDFLNYARPRALLRSTVDVGELLHQTFTLLRHSPEVSERQVIAEDVPAAPLLADADAEQLKQVFWNLARNGLQAMPDGGTLRAEMSRNSNGRVRIAFSDTGRGMSPEQVEQLFEPFSSTTGGTGLGLSIVYQIIRDHGGTINVRSLEGQGTTITVELPGETQESEDRSQEPEDRRQATEFV